MYEESREEEGEEAPEDEEEDEKEEEEGRVGEATDSSLAEANNTIRGLIQQTDAASSTRLGALVRHGCGEETVSGQAAEWRAGGFQRSCELWACARIFTEGNIGVRYRR